MNEIDTLVRGITEDKDGGIPYADVVGVLIFASFFISTFDRKGSGYITVNDVNRIMLNAKIEYASEINNNVKSKELNENENRNFSGFH